MAPTGPNRPRVSRETRLLLGIVFISVAMLWLLARLRFPERGTVPSPVPPLLTQLMPRSTFEDLALSITRLAPRFAGSVVALEFPETGGIRDGSRRRFVPGLKIRDDAAVTLVPSALDKAEDQAARPQDNSGSSSATPPPHSPLLTYRRRQQHCPRSGRRARWSRLDT